ncbi:MAG: site-2 protease family protein [Planctomycetota bacterium]
MLLQLLDNALGLLLIVLGFGLVIVVHEAGHFFAALWAGIRVQGFAVGFGPAAITYRKGLGLRRSSSEPEYRRLLAQQRARQLPGDPHDRGWISDGGTLVSPCEYRINWVPLGGYVKMLGQEDANPGAISDEPDSYQNASVPKRLVVISAGVVMNVILAAILFVLVFNIGLKQNPPIVGQLSDESPAARAGIVSGDRILEVDGAPVTTMNDAIVAVAMSKKDRPVPVVVQRPGEAAPIELSAEPEPGAQRGLLSLGIPPARQPTIGIEHTTRPDRAFITSTLERVGIDVPLGSTLVSAGGRSIEGSATIAPLREAARESNGAPISLAFKGPDTQVIEVSAAPEAEFMTGAVLFDDVPSGIQHLLGLTPLMKVAATNEDGAKAGLLTDDVFIRIGEADWPSMFEGISQIRAHAGREVALTILRGGELITLRAPVSTQGLVGFTPAGAFETSILADTPRFIDADTRKSVTPASSRLEPPVFGGVRIVAVSGETVTSLIDVREALQRVTLDAHNAGEPATVSLTLETLARESLDAALVDEATWELTPDDLARLHELSWTPGPIVAAFDLAAMTLKADGPLDALAMGAHETKRMLLMTYATFLRLYEGSVKIQALSGPVGIAHTGMQIAAQDLLSLIFFLAVISANLAVINFLPIPIVDGGMFLLLLAEGIRKKPVPIALQNGLTLIGLAIIGTVFVIVTYNDIARIFGS